MCSFSAHVLPRRSIVFAYVSQATRCLQAGNIAQDMGNGIERERERERGEDAIDLYAKLAAVVVAL